MKNSQSSRQKNQTKKEVIDQTKCCVCHRSFKKHQINSFQHFGCLKKVCYPCLYQMYKTQKQKLIKQNRIATKQILLQMNCCGGIGDSFTLIEQEFRQSVCVFCGTNSQQKQCMYEIENRFKFCRSCYKREVNKDNICESVTLLLTQISDCIPHNCLYCDSDLNFQKYSQSYQMMRAFNKKLCFECYQLSNKKPPIDIAKQLKEYKPLTVSKCYDKKQIMIKCCQICGQNIKIVKNHLFSTFSIDFNLIKWRDNKIYCGICLYFLYENKRQQFNKMTFQPLSVQVRQQEFECIRKSFQNILDERCIICFNRSNNDNSLQLLLDQHNNKQQLNKYPRYLLSLSCCQKCLKKLCQTELKDQQLIKIKNQIIQRDQRLQYTFKVMREINIYQLSQIQKKQTYGKFQKKKNIQPQKTQQRKHDNGDPFWSSRLKDENRIVGQQGIDQDKSTKNTMRINNNNYKQQIKVQKQGQKFYQKIDGDQQSIGPIYKGIDKKQQITQIIQIINMPPIQLKLTANLKSYSQIMSEVHEIKQNKNVYEKILDDMTNPDVLRQVFNLPTDQLWNSFIMQNSAISYSGKSTNISTIQNTNKNKPINTSQTIHHQQQCKIAKCPYKNKIISPNTINKPTSSYNRNPNNMIMNSREKQINQSNTKKNLINQSKQQVQSQRSSLLNLGLMCDYCFMLYLMGEIVLKDSVQSNILNQKIKQVSQLSKQLQQSYNNNKRQQ